MPEGEFYVQAAERLPFSDEHFDFVTCLGSLEHFVQPEQALAEMMRVAKADARFVLLVPNSGFLTRRLGLFAGTYQVDAREVVRSLDEWRDLFEGAGLEITEMWKDLHVVSWSWIKKGKWYQIPLRLLQALALPFWPVKWQYQVFHLCSKR
jgi:SAM-dependent methyltransferase